jgi:DNA-directed RNA polymerase subunit M/transcription elongation factor TFIIS
MIRFTCPTCQALLTRDDAHAGTKVVCPSCGQRLQVPAAPVNKTLLGEAVTPGNLPRRAIGATAAAVQRPQAVAAPALVPVGNCPGCGQALSVPRNLLGQRFQCPTCQTHLQAPEASPAAPPPTHMETTLLGLVKDTELERPAADVPSHANPGWVSAAPPESARPTTYPGLTDEPRDKNVIFLIAAVLSAVAVAAAVVIAVVLSHGDKEPQKLAAAKEGGQDKRQPAPSAGTPVRDRPPPNTGYKLNRPEPREPARATPAPTPDPARNRETQQPIPSKTPEEKSPPIFEPPAPAAPENPAPPPPSEDADRQKIDALVQTVETGNGQSDGRMKAAEALGNLGDKCNQPRITTALCKLLVEWRRDEEKGKVALAALRKINPLLHGAVILIYRDADPKNRAEGLDKLISLGSDGRPALPVLVGFKEELDKLPLPHTLGERALQAMGAVAADDPAMTERLLQWLRRPSEKYKGAIVLVLPHLKSHKNCVGALLPLLQDYTHPQLQVAVATALGQFGDDAKQDAVKKALEKLTTARNRPVREAATNALDTLWGGK